MAVETWAEADAYEPYVGRWSRPVAREFLAWLDAPPGMRWVDLGCGTGALTHTILRDCAPARVVAIDRSHGYLGAARSRATARAADFVVADATSLPLASGAADVVVSGLVVNFVPDPARMIREMTRLLRGDDPVGLYVWDYASGMELMRHFWDAAIDLDSGARELDEARRFPLCQPDALRALFEQCGVRDVEVRAIDVPTVFRSFDDYWSPFLGGQGPAPGYAMSLREDQRSELRERIRSRLPHAADGSISLIARAWAVRGRAA